MVSRTQVPQTSTTNQSTGPNTSTTNQSSSTTGSSSSRGGSSSTQTYNVRNMSSSALAALDSLIAGLNGGKATAGSQNAQFLREQWLEQLNASNQLRADYSKASAFADAEGASSAALADALEQSMPVIAAGIDSAGTSGSALSALLTQQAAEDAARTAAQIGLNAAISYGQISANALQTGAGLVQNGDPAMNSLLQALGIAKGAVQQGSVTSNESNWNNSSSQQNTTSTSTTVNSGQNSTATQTSGPAGKSNTVNQPPVTPTTPRSPNTQLWTTPSSYRSNVGSVSGNSYSQFGQ